MTIPVSDQRADQRRAEPPRAPGGFIKPAVNAKRRRGGHNGLARKQSRHDQPNHGQPNQAPRGIDAVAFMRRKVKPQRDRAVLAQRWAGPSQGA